jgi:ferredoxin-type protein NapF
MTAVETFSRSRRAFLRGRARQKLPLRPPWAVVEPTFLAACTACGDCIDACPETVLVRGDGQFPEFDPMQGECTFCEACADACEARALDLVSIGPAWTHKAQIADACLARNGVTCFSCRDACGEAAIRFAPALGGAVPELDLARCTGCGGCVGVCPVSAISLAEGARDG